MKKTKLINCDNCGERFEDVPETCPICGEKTFQGDILTPRYGRIKPGEYKIYFTLEDDPDAEVRSNEVYIFIVGKRNP